VNALTAVAAAGALTGIGTWLTITGWRPPPQPLAHALAGLDRPHIDARHIRAGLDDRLGHAARQYAPIERLLTSLTTDLRVLHRSPDEQAAQLVAYTLSGLLIAPIAAAGLRFVNGPTPIMLPLWAAVAGGTIAALATVRATRTHAATRRRMFAHALGSFCDVAGMCLSSGRGIDASIRTAAAAGDSWPFHELESALHRGHLRGLPPWDALAELGDECAFPDLVELAAALALAGDEGAAVRDTLASKAKAIRERLTADAERDAAAVTERMGLPATLLLLGFMVFLGFPAIHVLFDH
jgi:tight adherence protein C